jgi:Protein of unknown function (DUF3313)
MKRAGRVFMASVLGFILVASMMSCASTETAAPKTGFLGDYAMDLQPGPKGGAKERWLKPGVDFAKYDKIILEHVTFFLDDNAEYKGIDTTELDALAKQCDLDFADALKDSYPIVTEPGPDVLRVHLAITDLKPNNPTTGVLTTITMVSPIGLGINLIHKGATGKWTGSGATKAEGLVYDSMTNEVIAAFKDEQSAGFTERYTKWGSVEAAFKYWGERAKLFLDEAHGKKE